MNAKLRHFSEPSKPLSDKFTACNDFLSLSDRFKPWHSLRKLKMENYISFWFLVFGFWFLVFGW